MVTEMIIGVHLDQQKIGELTQRECEILRCSARGLSCLETGRELFIERLTVKSHRTSIIRKLLAKNITHAVAIGYERGILPITPLPIGVFINGILFQQSETE